MKKILTVLFTLVWGVLFFGYAGATPGPGIQRAATMGQVVKRPFVCKKRHHLLRMFEIHERHGIDAARAYSTQGVKVTGCAFRPRGFMVAPLEYAGSRILQFGGMHYEVQAWRVVLVRYNIMGYTFYINQNPIRKS